MNKRLFFIVIVALCAVEISAQGQATSTPTSENGSGIHPYIIEDSVAEKRAHWSLVIEGGINFFDGDYDKRQKMPGGMLGYPTVGLGVEYDFTPMWGMGLSYRYCMPRLEGDQNRGFPQWLLKQNMHRAQAYVTFDLINAWFRSAPKKIFGARLVAGGGGAWYKSSIYYTDSEDNPADYNENTVQSMDGYKFVPYLMGGAAFDFNLSRSIALGVEGTYSYFMNDLVDGRGVSLVTSKNNDGIMDLTMYLRYKINAVKRSHPYNVSSEDVLMARTVDKSKSGDAAQQYTPASKDTVVIMHKDTMFINRATFSATDIEEIIAEKQSEYYYVYFEPNKSQLDNEDLSTIQQVASSLLRNDNLYVEITGYCDNTGSADLNDALGVRRAAKVTDELVQEYGIDPSHIIYRGRGIIHGKRSQGAYAPNRRTELHIVSKSEFEKIKKDEAADQKSMKAAEKKNKNNKTVITSETEDQSDNTFVVTEGTTLSKLARENYNNTYAWVYIYLANKDIMKSPSDLKAGMMLRLPELTDAQKNISKDDAERLLRGEKIGSSKTEQTKGTQTNNKLAFGDENSLPTTITASKDMTLAKLARQYYGNTHCWVYIYEANRTSMVSPNNIVAGMPICIPALTQGQMAITREQADEMYRKSR